MVTVNRKIKYQSVEIDIVLPNTNYILTFETDRLYQKVKGVAILFIPLTGTVQPFIDFLKFKKFEIQNRELYPLDFYTKHLDTSNDVPLNKKFDLEIDEPAQGSVTHIIVNDVNPAFATTYKLIVTLKLENP